MRIEDADGVAPSVVSLYEVGQKVRLGKWLDIARFAQGLARQAQEDGLDLIRLSPAAALDASVLDWAHQHPSDRMIACVARAEGRALVSSDAAFDALGLDRVLE